MEIYLKIALTQFKKRNYSQKFFYADKRIFRDFDGDTAARCVAPIGVFPLFAAKVADLFPIAANFLRAKRPAPVQSQGLFYHFQMFLSNVSDNFKKFLWKNRHIPPVNHTYRKSGGSGNSRPCRFLFNTAQHLLFFCAAQKFRRGRPQNNYFRYFSDQNALALHPFFSLMFLPLVVRSSMVMFSSVSPCTSVSSSIRAANLYGSVT